MQLDAHSNKVKNLCVSYVRWIVQLLLHMIKKINMYIRFLLCLLNWNNKIYNSKNDRHLIFLFIFFCGVLLSSNVACCFNGKIITSWSFFFLPESQVLSASYPFNAAPVSISISLSRSRSLKHIHRNIPALKKKTFIFFFYVYTSNITAYVIILTHRNIPFSFINK